MTPLEKVGWTVLIASLVGLGVTIVYAIVKNVLGFIVSLLKAYNQNLGEVSLILVVVAAIGFALVKAGARDEDFD